MSKEYLPYAHAADYGTHESVGQNRAQILNKSFLWYEKQLQLAQNQQHTMDSFQLHITNSTMVHFHTFEVLYTVFFFFPESCQDSSLTWLRV